MEETDSLPSISLSWKTWFPRKLGTDDKSFSLELAVGWLNLSEEFMVWKMIELCGKTAAVSTFFIQVGLEVGAFLLLCLVSDQHLPSFRNPLLTSESMLLWWMFMNGVAT